MTGFTMGRVWARTPAVQMSFAVGLALVLSACAVSYRATCIDAGKLAGSPELTGCVQQRIDADRANRGRHINPVGNR